MNKTLLAFTAAAFVCLAGCSGPKPAPAWPDGTPRPINATMPTKGQQ